MTIKDEPLNGDDAQAASAIAVADCVQDRAPAAEDIAATVTGTENAPENVTVKPKAEYGGPKGLEPTRYGDWERNGRCYDF